MEFLNACQFGFDLMNTYLVDLSLKTIFLFCHVNNENFENAQ